MENLTAEEQTTALATLKLTDLQHLNELDVKIAQFKTDYSGLTIEDENDKEGLDNVKAALSVMRPTRTALDRERKSVTEPYRMAVTYINQKYDEKITAIADIEAPLKEQKEKVEDIIKEKKAEEIRREEEKLNNRIAELSKNGCSFDGSFYSIKDDELGISETSMGVVEIRSMSDDLFKQFLQVVMDKNAKIIAEKERIAAEEKQKEEARLEQQRKDQEEFDRKKKELDEQEARMKEQQAKMKEQQDKLDQQNREADEKIQRAEQQRINDLIKHRSAVLAGIGMTYNQGNDVFAYEEIEVSSDYICTAPEPGWLETVEEVTGKIKVKKDAHAKFLQEQEQKQKEAEKLAEQERLAALKDVEILKEYVGKLLEVPAPVIKTKRYNAAVQEIQTLLKSKLSLK